MNRWLALLASTAYLALVAAGCGGGGGNNNSGNTGGGTTSAQQSTQTTSSSSGGGGGKTVKVVMKNIQFSPKDVTVTKGGTVEWTNDDSVSHDVTKSGGPGPQFASGTGNLQQGATYKQTFNTPGKITYVCTVHPGMEGTITVK
ncbi:MAG TPA: plastocyanin/azurin family copper-binding protein [Thermoleophilaceae bacterium]